MLNRLLNIGISESYTETLNRKIRFSNLISLMSLISMIIFVPVAMHFQTWNPLLLLVFFSIVSVVNILLHHYKKHQASFYCFTILGYVYFTSSALGFGLISHMQYFMLVMCMISIVVFDDKLTIGVSITIALFLFFFLEYYMKDRPGFIDLPAYTLNFQIMVGYFILLLLFVITCVFFLFFKNANLSFQKNILIQKKIIEEKNKDITASINYAKKIQQSAMPTEKHIDQSIERLKK